MKASECLGSVPQATAPRVVVHLTASPFLGGPERQILGLISALPATYRSVILSFAEGGRCRPFLDEIRRLGSQAIELRQNAPRYRAAVREVAEHLHRLGADVLCCHGYKPDILGWMAARRAGVPVIAVSRGWTAATPKVRLNEALDRLCLRGMDRVICVSEGQAAKVHRAGVPADRVVVIRNAIRSERFEQPNPAGRDLLRRFFPDPPTAIVGAAGRLSPEKGFDVLVEAARLVGQARSDVGFIIFGDGPLRESLAGRIATAGLQCRFVLAGFRDDLDAFIPHLDLLALSSYTEGLPNVVLESLAAGVPVVATAVGGTPEIIEEGVHGHLVAAGDPVAMADRIGRVLSDEIRRRAMGRCGRRHIREHFTFEAQSQQYQRLFEALRGRFAAGPGESSYMIAPNLIGETGDGVAGECGSGRRADSAPASAPPLHCRTLLRN